MILVTNISPGNVQIRSSGKPTPGGKSDHVDVIDARLIRLRDAGLISWPGADDSLKAKPADAPIPPPPITPVEKPELVLEKAEVPEVKGAQPSEETVLDVLNKPNPMEVALPVREVVEEPEAAPEPEPAPIITEDVLKKAEEKAVASEPPVTTPIDHIEEVIEEESALVEAEEPVIIPEDHRTIAERARLAAMEWKAIKEEARDKGVKGRSREIIEEKLVELFVSELS